MHQDPAKRVMAVAAFLVLAAVDVLRDFDKFGASTLIGKLRRVLQQQYRATGRFKACTRRVEVPAQNIAFVHPFIGKEPIGRFGVGPILARERNAFSDPASHPDQKLAKPFAKTRIPEDILANFPVDPMGGTARSVIYFCRSRRSRQAQCRPRQSHGAPRSPDSGAQQ
ncbi:hypothetical protein ABIB73_007579 [Bradyrhizobium sp. F1.4.3]